MTVEHIPGIVLYVAKRLLLSIPAVLTVTVMVFLLMRIIPGDPALLILAGVSGDGSFKKEDLQHLRHELGTDRPSILQYANWLWGLLHGDLGTSLFYRTQIMHEIGPRLPPTLELAFLAVFVSVVLAVPLGALSAVKQNSLLDYVARSFTFTGISVPIFVIGLTVIYLLVRVFGWFPPLGYAFFGKILGQTSNRCSSRPWRWPSLS